MTCRGSVIWDLIIFSGRLSLATFGSLFLMSNYVDV
ncbi:hypothetical protein BVRB_8g198090 [Beta vulgaris subsp. vulgaris]|nr:hypothetical protein BVRB_8g198090 [Beta vulgaris subsp. vulgaris]